MGSVSQPSLSATTGIRSPSTAQRYRARMGKIFSLEFLRKNILDTEIAEDKTHGHT